MADNLILGIDPGTRGTGWAVLQASPTRILAVGILKPKGGPVASVIRQLLPPIEMIVDKWKPRLTIIEGQHFHPGGASPAKHILKLAQTAGGIAGMVMASCESLVTIVGADEWKGQTPKRISQSRTYAKLGVLTTVEKDFTRPSGCATIARVEGAACLKTGDWRDVGDAIGIALFAAEKL